MGASVKNQQEILAKMKIQELNQMQKETHLAFTAQEDIILLSPTGSGKTLAFLLPIIEALDAESKEIQVLILVPSRELALQIEQVIREMGSGFKANAIYGGRASSKDKIDLQHKPAILVGTPGRIADHMRRETFAVNDIKTLVLDEYDKSLEVGFESEMKEIIWNLPAVEKRMLTSATAPDHIPAFLGLRNPFILNFLEDGTQTLTLKVVESPTADKLETLGELLQKLAGQPGIVFCNFKDSIDRVSEYIQHLKIPHACFYGGLEQNDRERALIKFRNGTYKVLIATDLAARGIDIPEIKYIIHYHLPVKEEEFIHRNGRTARMNEDGIAYVLKGKDENLAEFIKADQIAIQNIKKENIKADAWVTLFISGGRKDKISKGDIAGLFIKEGKIKQDELGLIELKRDCAFVAVKADSKNQLIQTLNNSKLKNKKVRISLLP